MPECATKKSTQTTPYWPKTRSIANVGPPQGWCSSPHLALLVASPATIGLDLRFELVNAVAERHIVGPEPERPSQ